MEDIAGHGRTILFVSHSMGAVQQLCDRVLWLEQGRMVEDTHDIAGVARRYLFGAEGQVSSMQIEETKPNHILKITHISVGDENGVAYASSVEASAPIFVRIEANIEDPQIDLKIGYGLFDEAGQLLYRSFATDGAPEVWPQLVKGRCVLRTQIPPRLLNEGLYRIEVVAGLHNKQWAYAPNQLPHITFRILGGLSDSPHWIGRRDGVFAPVFLWQRVG